MSNRRRIQLAAASTCLWLAVVSGAARADWRPAGSVPASPYGTLLTLDGMGRSVVLFGGGLDGQSTVKASMRRPGGVFEALQQLSRTAVYAFPCALASNGRGDALAAWGTEQYIPARESTFGTASAPPARPFAPAQELPVSTGSCTAAVGSRGGAVIIYRGAGGATFAAFRGAGEAGFTRRQRLSGGEALGPDSVAIDRAGDAIVLLTAPGGGFRHRGRSLRVAVARAGRPYGSLRTLARDDLAPRETRLALNQRGDALVVWRTGHGGAAVHAVARAPGKSTFGRARRLAAHGHPAARPAVALDTAGRAVVAWGGGVHGVVQAVSRRAGGRFGRPRTLSSAATGVPDSPAVAMNSGGAALVSWRRSTGYPNTGPFVLQAATRASAGRFRRTERLVTPGEESLHLDAAVDDAGYVVAVWSGRDSARQTVEGASWRAGRAFPGARLLAIADPDRQRYEDQVAPQLAIASGGHAAAAWFRAQSGHVKALQGAERAPGAQFGSASDLAPVAEEQSVRPRVARNAAGAAIVLWPESGGLRAVAYDSPGG